MTLSRSEELLLSLMRPVLYATTVSGVLLPELKKKKHLVNSYLCHVFLAESLGHTEHVLLQEVLPELVFLGSVRAAPDSRIVDVR